jgi:hypothetical protein
MAVRAGAQGTCVHVVCVASSGSALGAACAGCFVLCSVACAATRDLHSQLWSFSTQAGELAVGAKLGAAAAAECVSVLLSDGHGDVRVLCARDVAREAEGRGFLQQRVIEHGRLQASLLSVAPAWMSLASREVGCQGSMGSSSHIAMLLLLLLPQYSHMCSQRWTTTCTKASARARA